MRRALLAVPLLALPIVLAFAKGGYFDTARLWAAVAVWALAGRRRRHRAVTAAGRHAGATAPSGASRR